jgi:hypothetical protein
VASGYRKVVDEIMNHSPEKMIGEAVHDILLRLLGEYVALGGMPQVVDDWIHNKKALHCMDIQLALLGAYRNDFLKYARTSQVKYVDIVFNNIPLQLGRKFKYSLIEGDYRKRELAPALDLLVTAGVVHKVFHSAGQGIPLGAQIDLQDYKIIFLDTGLAQALLHLDLTQWFINSSYELVNKGEWIEAFVGQELVAYGKSSYKYDQYYWHKEGAAEIDYLIGIKGQVVPIEVKSGTGRTLKSLQIFLDTHKKSTYGIRFSTQNYSVYQNIYSYPLYAIAAVVAQADDQMKEAIKTLMIV